MFGIIGKPLGHSFSAKFFNEKFSREGIDDHYELFPLERIEKFTQLLATHPDLKGLNVTIPYKEKIIPYLTALDRIAEEIGAVNVIKISEDGKSIKGYNTDAIGFRDTISPLLKPEMKKALVLGTGGAARAVIYVLQQLGLEVQSVSRKKTDNTITYEELTPEIMDSHKVIVNTTPLGMWPATDEAPDLPYGHISSGHLCYDLVYNPETTKFMSLCAKNGAIVKNGLDMLHGQALAAWSIWNS